MDIREHIRAVPDFPKAGILFRDITPVVESPAVYAAALDGMRQLVEPLEYDRIAGIESRGFIFGGPLALQVKKSMVLVRKAGELPAATHAVSYALEYGEATLEVHVDSIKSGERVLVVDDLLATGGTARATADLVRESGGIVAGFLFLVELEFLGGRAGLEATAPVFSLVRY